mmetsp:Transcript_27632/g.38871  ORF Transcript_27632/g.38871 Transcript_27632/m.38871 type:complete len:125 (-) Transcript_27632:134-508(-)
MFRVLNLGNLMYGLTTRQTYLTKKKRNFFSGRILWDESMASTASAWTSTNPNGLVIGLVSADHVKFKNGIIPGRHSMMAGATSDCTSIITSIILNPTLMDKRPSGSVYDIPGADSSRYPDKLTL